MAYSYDPIFAADPSNAANVAANASIIIFDPNDPGKAPVTITDVTGSPLPNPITVNKNGFGPAFQHATLDRVGWFGAGFTGYFTSYEGMKAVAVAAKVAAEAAAIDAGVEAAAAVASVIADADASAASAATSATAAANSAALVGAPADTVIAAAVNGSGSATNMALYAMISTAVGTVAANILRPTGTRLAWLGDSIIRGNDEQPPIDGKSKYIRGDSLPNYTALQSGQRARDWVNAGVFGHTSSAGLARVQTDVIARNPSACVVFFGANDAANNVTLATFSANMTAIVNALHAANIKVFLMTPITQNGMTARNVVLKSYGDWLKSYGAANGIDVIDLYTAATDPATGFMYASFNGDGTHPGPAGYKILGKYVADTIKAKFPQPSLELSTISADPTSLLQVGTFTGTPAAGIAGGWGVYGSNPGDAVMSVVTDALVPGNMQRITRSSAGGNMVLYANVASGFVPGDVLQFSGIVTATGSVPTARLLFNHPTLFLYADGVNITQTITRGRFDLEVPVPAGTTSITVQLFGGPGTGNADFGQITLRNLTTLGLV